MALALRDPESAQYKAVGFVVLGGKCLFVLDASALGGWIFTLVFQGKVCGQKKSKACKMTKL